MARSRATGSGHNAKTVRLEDRSASDSVLQSNVLLQLENLSTTYPAVRQGLTQDTAGWWFNIAISEMQVYDPFTLSFELLNNELIDRLTG
jgi:hypothetical protein